MNSNAPRCSSSNESSAKNSKPCASWPRRASPRRRGYESWSEPLTKFKTPHDFAISAYRLLDVAPESLQPITAFLTQAGQRPYTPGSPAGWPDTAASWNGGDALLKRIEFASAEDPTRLS